MTATYRIGRRRFELTIFGYTRYRGTLPEDWSYWDVNWVDMHILATDGTRTTTITGSWMTTSEIESMARWIETMAAGYYDAIPYQPTEMYPELEIERLPARHPELRVTLVQHPKQDERTRHTVRMDADPAALRIFANELRAELAPFPIIVSPTERDRFVSKGTPGEPWKRLHRIRLRRRDRFQRRYGR